jgi:hypothetical protein
MLGIDDNDPEHLRIVPRYPEEWNFMSITGYPLLTEEFRHHINYIYKRTNDDQTFEFKFENPVKSFSLRLGPIPQNVNVRSASINNDETVFEIVESGDSKWVWIQNLRGISGIVRIETR